MNLVKQALPTKLPPSTFDKTSRKSEMLIWCWRQWISHWPQSFQLSTFECANMASYIYCYLVNWCQWTSLTSRLVLSVLYFSIILANQSWVIIWNCTYTSCSIHTQREWRWNTKPMTWILEEDTLESKNCVKPHLIFVTTITTAGCVKGLSQV